MFFTAFRVLPAAVLSKLRPAGGPSCRTRHRVRLTDVDFNWHMNQAAYPQVAELSRTQWLFSTRAWPDWRAQDVYAVLAGQSITYRRELKPFQAFEIDTRAVGMDGRLLTVESHFLSGRTVNAKLTVQLIFIGPDGVMAAEAVAPLVEALIVDPLAVEDWKVVGD